MVDKSKKDFNLLAVFLGSASIFLFGMTHIRLFSYSLPPIPAFSGIGPAMAGFGIGALLPALIPSLTSPRQNRILSILALIQGAAMFVSCAVFARTSWNAVLSLDDGIITFVLGVLAPGMLPYFFCGLFLSIVFSSSAERIGKTYFIALLGAGVGVVLITVLLTSLGAEKVIGIAAILSALSALILSVPSYRKTAIVAALALVASAFLTPYLTEVFPFQADPMDTTGISIRSSNRGETKAFHRELDEWNIAGRTEIWKQEDSLITAPESVEYRVLAIDSGKSTVLIRDPEINGWGKELFEQTFYGLAYHAKPEPAEVLVIGAGGGLHIQAALHWNASHITAVENNSSTIAALKGPLASFTKWPLSQRVSIVNADGRSFVKSASERFDVIQISGVDTLAAHATGSFSTKEEHLYTVEAFGDYLDALKPDGVFAVVRFGRMHIRLGAIACEALLRQGIKNPENHIAAFKQDMTATILVSKSGFSKEQLDAITMTGARRTTNAVSIPAYEMFGLYLSKPIRIHHLPGRIDSKEFLSYARAVSTNPNKRHKAMKRLSIPTDDNPFFLLSWITEKDQTLLGDNVKLLDLFWKATSILVLALILAPVIVLGRKRTSWKPLLFVLPYFFLVGACFMMLEVGIITRFAIFVGSPGASTTVVLTSILIASGLGSYVSGIVTKGPATKIAISTVILVVAALGVWFLSPSVFEACWSSGFGGVARGFVTAAMVAPLGFATGWFFPTGLRAIDVYLMDRRLNAWAVSIIGLASIFGLISALPISVYFGFSHLFLAALTGYVLAGLIAYAFFFRKI
ncbi:MAG: hypothetical protein GY854_31245 [Deltaproteobacteria bacterium]|nr:hypothetical protein [Deltaproteobacteria bacterium]